MSCLSVTFERVQANLSVVFAELCGTDIGEAFLFDSNGAALLTSDNEYIIAK